MKVAYVDTSCLVAIAFGEPGADELADRLDGYDVLASSTLLEAELRSAMAREDAGGDAVMLERLAWVFPERRLTPEIDRVLQAGYARGADLQHVAVALYLAESPSDVDFLTLDEAQARVAAAVGFQAPG